jgi:hypothetical protein
MITWYSVENTTIERDERRVRNILSSLGSYARGHHGLAVLMGDHTGGVIPIWLVDEVQTIFLGDVSPFNNYQYQPLKLSDIAHSKVVLLLKNQCY